MQSKLAKHNIVLLGAGHTNAHILRMWRMKPIKDAQLICVSNYSIATYSGMLPGVLAGNYDPERMEIDLVRLCASVGARLIVDRLTGVDLRQRRLHFATRPSLPFDALSVGIGSGPDMTGVDESENIVPIKPMQTFLQRLEHAVQSRRPGDRPMSLAVVGGGLGGVEISMGLPRRLESWLGDQPFNVSLVTSGPVGAGLGAGAAAKLQRELQEKGVIEESGRRVARVENGQLVYESGERGTYDVVLWATSAVAPEALSLFDLPKDERGFLLVDRKLQCLGGDAPVFAVGDSGTIENEHLPKAGVYAVRQGPILFRNLRRLLRREPLIEYRPQRKFLKLVNLGDGRAIGEWGPLSVSGAWMWRLKDWIDSRFMDKYQQYEAPMMDMAPPDPDEMHCAGCGGKVGPSVLRRALERLERQDEGDVRVGLDQPDDVALVDIQGSGPLAATVDFFAAPFDDPYLVGRVAALNSASDMFASGVSAQAAMTVATVPYGHPRAQEQMMYELMAGGMEEFAKSQTALIGGHTTEGPQLTIGFAMLGRSREGQAALLKAGVEPGDVFLLTKPIGAGVLLAAHMKAECRAEWWAPLLKNLLTSNQAGAESLRECGAHALTDVTGFGLAGHWLEMLQASNVSAELWLDRTPILEGAESLAGEGVESTLNPANRAAEAKMEVDEATRSTARYSLLFDPQTSGGLLAAIPSERVDSTIQRLASLGISAVAVGRAQAADGAPLLKIVSGDAARS